MLQSKPGRLFSSPSFSMASLSSLFLSNPRSFLPSHPNPSHQIHLSQRHQIVNFSSNSSRDPNLTINQPPPPEKKKSFAVVSGEIFVSLASRIIQRRNGGEREDPIFAPIGTSEGNSEREPIFWRRRKEGIASLVEDPAEPEVVWEQRPKHVEAERGRAVMTSPGFSFSAAGLLFPYHLGVAEFLIEKSYIKDRTPLAGSSAGAIVCAVIASGASMQEALKATKVLAEDCRQRGTAFRLGAVLRDVLDKFLPNDVHARSNGRIRVAVTQLLWRPRGLLVDMFDSREDLINAVITSSFVPGYLAPRPATMFRNRLCVDGGMTFFMPPTSAAETLLYVHRYYLGGKDHIAVPGVTIHSSNIVSEEARLAFSRQVRICAFPASQLGLQGIGISPDCNPENRATPRQLFGWALEPADDHVLDNLFELGYQDAAVWAKENPVEKIVSDNCQCTENSAGAIASHQGS